MVESGATQVKTMTDGHIAMMANHDVRLVLLSVLIAIIASYTALNLAGRVTVAQGRTRTFLWLAGGAIAMGVGIWSMHFIAMLAYNLPIPIAYNLPIVLVSMAVAVVASGVALLVVSRQTMSRLQLLTGGVFMGLSIAAMHYTGMVAMQLEALVHYDQTLVALSIAIAIGASLSALWLAFHFRTDTTINGSVWKLGSATIMGNAIAGTHYTAMAAVSFKPTSESVVGSFHTTNNSLLAIGIGIATLVILTLALLTSVFDQRISVETARAEALRQSEERFRSLVQNASDIITVVAADRSVSYASPTIKPILGYEPDTWNSAFEFVHPEDIAKAESLLKKVLDCPDANIAAEFRLRRADGQARDFEVIANNLLRESSVAGILTTYRDITERKQAEVALRQQTERERLVAEIGQRIRQSLNLEEILSTTVSEVRQFLQTERVFIYRFEPDWSGIVAVESVAPGYSPLVGMKVKDSFFAETSNRNLYKQGRVQATEDVYTAGLSPCHIDFLTQLQVRANLVVTIMQEQQLWGLLVANHCSEPRQWQQLEINLLKQLATQVAIAIQQSTLFEQAQTEIAERKRAEAEIKKLNKDLQLRAAALEAANKELESFSYSVSHDLRAPLRAMNGFSRILINEYAPQFTPEVRRYLQIVRDNAQQMGCLIDDLLTFSRLNRSPLKKQLVAPADLVRQVFAELGHEQKNQDIEISLGELPTCHADQALLKQVWVNLIANALKFTGQRQVAHIQIGCLQTDGTVYFVKDNGVGFDMQYAHKLFGVFQRLHRAEDYNGTGVGLAIVQRIIHRHGGQIWAEAEVNKGATFYFTLGEDIHYDRDRGRNPVSGGQPERCGINTALLEKQ